MTRTTLHQASATKSPARQNATDQGPQSLAGTQALRLQQTAGNHAVSQLIDSIGGGEPIDRELRELLESRFDADFQQVRIHRDSAAAASAEQLNAVAFTTGTNIVFGQGSYQPGTPAGVELLAHELAHVVQQFGGQSGPLGESEGFEHEAQAAASAVLTEAAPPGIAAGSAPTGAIQKQVKERDPEKENVASGLRRVPESWPNFVDNPKFTGVIEENPDIGQALFQLPEYRTWLKNPAVRPAKWRSAPDAQPTAAGPEPAGAESEAPPVFSEFPPLRAADAPPANQTTARPPTAEERFKESFFRTSTLKQKGEAKIPVRPRKFYGKYERLRDQAAAEAKQMIGVAFPVGGTLGWDLAELATGETAVSQPVDRLDKAKDVLFETAMQATFFLPEGQIVEGIAGGAKAPLQEGAAMLPEQVDAASAAKGTVQELPGGGAQTLSETPQAKANMGRALELPAPESHFPLEGTETPSGISEEAERRAEGFAHTTDVDPGRKPHGFESGRASPGHDLAPGGLEDMESHVNEPARRPRSNHFTEAQQLEGLTLTRQRASTEAFLDDSLKKLSDLNHPAHDALVVEVGTDAQGNTIYDWRKTERTTQSGQTQIGRYPGNEEGLVIQVGHEDAFASGLEEKFMLEDADTNIVGGATIESKGLTSHKRSIDIGGVKFDYDTAKRMERMGKLKNFKVPDL